jgi:putative ABC transport system permease protein
MSGEQWTASFAVEGRSGADSAGARIRVISPGYFSLMRIPLREGASFDEEGEGAERRVVIDEAAAERYWPGASAVGRRITFSDDDDAEIVWWTVAGVVGSIRDESLGLSPEPHVYIPHSMHPERGFFVAVRTDGGAGRDVGTLFRDAVRGLDPQLPVWDVVTAEQYLASSLALQRFRLSTLWAFGLTGLTLAALGVYGVVAFAFSLAKGDHAIRLALGATREHLVGLGLRSVARPALAGAAIGVVASAALSELLARILAGVPAWSPAAAAIASLVVAALVALAALLPATMLSNVDPVDALRST